MAAPSPMTLTSTWKVVTIAAFLFLFCLGLSARADSTDVIRVKLIQRDSLAAAGATNVAEDAEEGSFLSGERIRHAIERSHAREEAINRAIVALLSDLYTDAAGEKRKHRRGAGGYKAPVSPGNGEFLLKISIGTPAVQFLAILDTGSDLIWTQCKPCKHCFKQQTRLFDPAKSSSYKAVACASAACKALPQGQSACGRNRQCQYEYGYGDGSYTTGVMATETFALSGTALPGIAFGCGHDNNGEGLDQGAGLVGFGRGQLSLPSQFARASSASAAAFAYCLVATSGGSSPMWLGAGARSAFPGGPNAGSTPLIVNQGVDTFYYVSVTGITVGNSAVRIPRGAFDIRSDGSGGLIVDSGTILTYLERRTYNNLIKALKEATRLTPTDGSSAGLDLCYDAESASTANDFPTVTLTFQGGARLAWTPINYMIQIDNLVCAALAPSSGNGSISIIGNIGQMNFFVLYDNSANKLSIAPAKCNSL